MANIIDIARALPPWAILAFGVVTGSLRTAWSFLYAHTIGYAVTRVTLSLTVEDIEYRRAYLWLSHWVESNLRNRRVNSLLLRKAEVRSEAEAHEQPAFRLIPEYGTYYMKWKRRLMVVTHSKESQQMNMSRPQQAHTMRIQIWLARDRSLLLDIIREAKEAFDRSQPVTIEHYRADNYGDWRLETIAPRDMDSVYLPHDQLAELVTDIETFLEAKPIYRELGIPYRRGYQLAGPPGTGKSTLILSLASKFRLPLYSLALRGAEMTGSQLAGLLADCRKPAIVALEDIDCVKTSVSRKSKGGQGVSMSDLLNVIDGIGASEDRLLFMTTNEPEILDPALVRAGRMDRKFYIDYARDEELKRFHDRVSLYFAIEPWPEFRAALPRKATIADAQAMAFRRRESEREAELVSESER